MVPVVIYTCNNVNYQYVEIRPNVDDALSTTEPSFVESALYNYNGYISL